MANPRFCIPQDQRRLGVTVPDPVVYQQERAMVFVDAMNLYESLGGLNMATNVDYYKFAGKLAEAHRRLVRCYVYTGAYDQIREPARYAAQVRYFNRVHKMPFVTLKTRPLIARGATDRHRHGIDGVSGALRHRGPGLRRR